MDKVKISNEYSSETKLGFGFMQVQNLDPFQNFLKKIEVDDERNKLTLTFSKLAKTPIIIDFKNQKMTLPSNKQKDFDKFVSVTFEYCKERHAVVVKTFRFEKGNMQKGIKHIDVKDLKNVKLTNFLNIYSDNYFKTSKKLIENDNSYVIPIPDFYRPLLTES